MNNALLINLARQELVDRYAGSVLGSGWAILRPLVNILIFVLVFSKVMGARLALLGSPPSEYSYSIYLVSGLLVWNAFSETILRITTVFQDKAALIGKIKLSLPQLPFFIITTEAVIYVLSMAFFAVFLLSIDYPVGWHWAWLLVIFLVQQVLAYALGFLGAVIGVFFRDVRELAGIVLQLWFWLTPIVYVFDILPKPVQSALIWNPAYIIISAQRQVILYGESPDLGGLAALLAIACGVVYGTLRAFRRLERDIRDFI